MRVKVLIAGGGIALTAIIPFATLNKLPNGVPVQVAPQYADLSSLQGSDRTEDLNPSSDGSKGLGVEINSRGPEGSSLPSLSDLDPDIQKIFTPFNEPPKSPSKKLITFQSLNCQKTDGETGEEESFTCLDDSKQAQFGKHTDLLNHYLKRNELSIDIVRAPDEPKFYMSPSS